MLFKILEYIFVIVVTSYAGYIFMKRGFRKPFEKKK